MVVFDAPGTTFRHEAYADYKATRQKMPEELSDQLGTRVAIMPRNKGAGRLSIDYSSLDQLDALLAGIGNSAPHQEMR